MLAQWRNWAASRGHALATAILFALLGIVFFTQEPIEARSRPWRGPHVSEDGWYYYHWLRSAAFDHDLDLTNDYRAFGNWYGFGQTKTGRPHNPFGIGPAIFWAPGFTVGHLIAKLLPDECRVADGYSAAEQAGALSTSLFASAGAFWITFSICRHYVRAWTAWFATALAFLGSPLIWYTLYSPSMPHALEACFGSAFLWALVPLRRRRPREAALLGLASGCMILVRPQLAVFLALPLAEALREVWLNRSAARPLWPPLASLLVTFVVAFAVFSPQLYTWKLVYGSYFVVPQGSGFMRFTGSLWCEPLFSSRNGLFTTTPLLWFVLPGLYLIVRRERQLGALLLFCFAALAFTNGAAWDWWGGGAFGGRRFSAIFPIWALALAALGATLVAPGKGMTMRTLLVVSSTSGLLYLQLCMVLAHHDRKFTWEETLPFDQRIELATGHTWAGYDVTGNPFAFPANVLFSLRYGVPLTRYDRAVGPYLLDERLPTTNPGLPRKRRETVDLSKEDAIAHFGCGFAPTANGAELRASGGELLLPINRPGGLSLALSLKTPSPDALRWFFNGHPLDATLQIQASWINRGINALRVEAPGVSKLVIRSVTLVEGNDWPPSWSTQYD